jgi:succinate dehydrogenase hydrophobic anchor subunit
VHFVVRLDQGEGVRRAADSTADPHWAAARDRWMTAPSLDAVALQSGSTTIAIPATAISEDWSKPSGTAGWVVLGCVAALVVIVAIGAAAAASTADSIARGLGGTP